MKKIIVFILIATLASCNLFRKVEKEKRLEENKEQQGSKAQTKDVDTGNTEVVERLRLKMRMYDPNAINSLNTPNYNPPSYQGADPSVIKDDVNSLQDHTQRMNGYLGTLELQLDRFIKDQRGKTNENSKQDTLSKSSSKSDESIKKDAIIPWWVILIAIVSAFIFWDLLKAVFTKFILKK